VPAPRLLKTASFRLTALYSAVFMLSFALLLLLTYLILTAALRDQIKVKVEEDLQALSAEYREDGLSSIIKDVEEKSGLTQTLGVFYYLENAAGAKLAGKLSNIKRVTGRYIAGQEFSVRRTGRHTRAVSARGDHRHLLVVWRRGLAACSAGRHDHKPGLSETH
jgi:hypothetical protein